MFDEGDLGEDRQVFAELLKIEGCTIATDVTRFLEALYAREARAWRQSDGVRKLDIGDTA